MRTREQLLQQISDEREHWRKLTDEIGRERMEQPGPMGEWTFKDLAAHLTGWRDRTISRIESGPHSEPPTPWPAHMTEDDEINDWIHAQNRNRPLDEVLANADNSFERLAAALNALSDEDLQTPGRFAWAGDQALVDADFFGHLHEEHEPDIRAWLAGA